MLITRSVLEAHLQCKYKAYLRLTGENGSKSDYQIMLDDRRAKVRRTALAKMQPPDQEVKVAHNTLLGMALLKRGVPYLFDVTAKTDSLEFHFDGLKKLDGVSRLGQFYYIPILFHEGSTVRKEQRTLLELACLVLERLEGHRPNSGIVYYGKECNSTKARLDANLKKGSRLLSEAVMMASSQSPPRLLLSKHCDICEFEQRCLQQALDEDSLSLLRGMGEKEINRYARRGLLTLTQLAHTFRPRRKGKRQQPSRKRHHALHAMAIRDKTIYVFGTPEAGATPVSIYLDCEGDPDEGYVYLIGLIVSNGDSEERYSFWSDDRTQENDIFEQFLSTVSKYEDTTVFCYGSYEKAFLQRMRKKAKRKRPVDKVLGALVNVLSLVYSHLYFPCYSNGLKDVGRVLGFTWSDEAASGLRSVLWRANWEVTRNDKWKKRLTTYNLDDSAALKRVTKFISTVSTQAKSAAEPLPNSDTGFRVASVAEIDKLAQPRKKWGPVDFFHSDYKYINKCAYFDYQRERVYVRTSKTLRKSKRKKRTGHNRNGTLRVTKRVEVAASQCPSCKSRDLARKIRGATPGVPRPRRKRAFDLVVTPSGIKRKVIEYRSSVHLCRQCGHYFVPDRYARVAMHLHGLRSWAMYQHVAHRMSFGAIETICGDMFGVYVPETDILMFKALMAHYYRSTYRALLRKICSGDVLHVDETPVKLKTGRGYVWVFTSQEEVVFMYRPTRKADFLQPLLKEFRGVLVSDFYTAYDSFECPQQKCLIHLMRDMNHDLLSNPYDQQLQLITEPFGTLLRSVVETVDRHGLKKRHLKRHEWDVKKYFRLLASRNFQSEAAESLRNRLITYQDKLFTFIHHDGVAWNNNNAENAIKRFAYYRAKTTGNMTETGLSDYLMLLSFYQTCRYKAINFLEFLLSRERDLNAFCENRRRKRRSPSIEVYPRGLTTCGWERTRQKSEQ
ncbi:MAG: IS66 family transposase [Planctomycetota bacterium]